MKETKLTAESNKSYFGYLSLKNGLLLHPIGTLAIQAYLSDIDTTDFISIYFRFRIPGTSMHSNGLTVLSVVMSAVGMAGCQKKSTKLIRYYKRYLMFDMIYTPLVLIDITWTTYWDIRSILKSSDVSWEEYLEAVRKEYGSYVFTCMALVFVAGYAQQTYATYLAYRYEKYLMKSDNS